VVTTLSTKDKCSKVGVWVDLVSKFLRMFLSNSYYEDTETLLIPLDFAEFLSEIKIGKLANKLAHSLKLILFEFGNLGLKTGINMNKNIPKILFLTKRGDGC